MEGKYDLVYPKLCLTEWNLNHGTTILSWNYSFSWVAPAGTNENHSYFQGETPSVPEKVGQWIGPISIMVPTHICARINT